MLARDRVGKKPLLWTRLPDGTLAFASELKALLRLPGVSRELDPAALDAYLALQYVPAGTALRGVEKLPPGHVLVAEGGRGPRRAVLAARARGSVRGRVARARPRDGRRGGRGGGSSRTSRSVRSSPAGSTRASSSPRWRRPAGTVRTFTVGFGDERYDERAYARAVAERYGTEHEEIVVEPDVAELLPRLAAAFDEPLGDEAALPQFVVCELARRHVTVALDGRRRRRGVRRLRAVRGGRARRPGRAAGRGPRGAGAPLRRARRAALAREPRRPPARGRRAAGAGALRAADGGLPGDAARRAVGAVVRRASRCRRGSCSARPGEGISGCSASTSATYLPGDLLLKADIASMAHSLELRSPLLDHEVLELGVSLPDSLKVERPPRQGRAPPRVRGRAAARGRRPRQDGLRRADLRAGSAASCASSPPTLLLDERARARGQLRPAAVERLLGRARGRPRRPRPPALVPADARALAARARRRPVRGRGRARERGVPGSWSRSSRPFRGWSCSLVERNDILTAFTEKSDDLARDLRPLAARSASSPASRPRGRSRSTRWFLIPIYWIFGRSWWAVGLIQIARRGRDRAARLRDRPAVRLARAPAWSPRSSRRSTRTSSGTTST